MPAPAFAAALDQVLPAAGSDPERPILWCVLVEAREGSLRVVATDAHRLVVRDLAPAAPGGAFRGLVPAATLRRWPDEPPDQLPGTGMMTGPDAHVALDPAAADTLRAAVGRDVVIEIADPLAHVVVRSADDGTATTLLMPVRLD